MRILLYLLLFTPLLLLGCAASHSASLADSSETDRSPGCHQSAPAEPPTQLTVGGVTRRLIMVVPVDYQPDRPHALVVAFHGRTNDNQQVRRYYGLESAVRVSTVFVYPAGINHGNRFSWSDPADPAERLRDYALFDALVARIGSDYCIDRQRIYAVGHSLGAWFVNSLACARGEQLRAIATVAGGISAGRCRGRVAALLLHNPNDRLVPFAQGEAARDRLRQQNELSGRSTVLSGPLNCRRYGPVAHRYPVVWCAHDYNLNRRGRYYPHQWPPGTGDRIMRFFEALP